MSDGEYETFCKETGETLVKGVQLLLGSYDTDRFLVLVQESLPKLRAIESRPLLELEVVEKTHLYRNLE